jgi:S-adenosylmethionine decarboxylase
MDLPNHVIFDIYNIQWEGFDDEKEIKKFMHELCEDLKMDLVGEISKKLEPHGLIYVCLLLQSHISYHSWPEYKYAALDIFTCGEISPIKIVEKVKQKFQTEDVIIKEIDRIPDLRYR